MDFRANFELQTRNWQAKIYDMIAANHFFALYQVQQKQSVYSKTQIRFAPGYFIRIIVAQICYIHKNRQDIFFVNACDNYRQNNDLRHAQQTEPGISTA